MTLRGESDFKKKQGKKEKTDLKRGRSHIPVRPHFLSIGQPSTERAVDEDIPADGKESEVRVRRAEPVEGKRNRNGKRRILQRTVYV